MHLCLNYSKSDAADTASKAWEHAVQQHRLIKALMEENRTLTSRVMENKEKVIQLQSKLAVGEPGESVEGCSFNR